MSTRGAIDVLFLNWRDETHPEGGGSERYVHRVAEGLAAAGLRVALHCAAHPGAPARETVRGVQVHRRGGRLGVYPAALAAVRRLRPAFVVDVQNGVPFLSTVVSGGRTVVLVHHVHREQWPIVFGRLGGRLGWWLESRLAPWAYRRCDYVTVSEATRGELAALGVAPGRVAVVRNGLDPAPPVDAVPSPTPRLVVLARLVPHKRVEHALQVLADLAPAHPALVLDVVGEGWWHEELVAEATRLGVLDRVVFHGFVDDATKHALLARAWVHLCPSVKEGWGLAVSEAGAQGVPTVGHRSAGGLRESVVDGVTGLLVDDEAGFRAAVERLLGDPAQRAALGRAARAHAEQLSWPATVAGFAAVLAAAGARREGSAGAVVQDVGGRGALVGLRRLVGRADRGGDGTGAGDGGHAHGRTTGERDGQGDEGLHGSVLFSSTPSVRRAAQTVDGAGPFGNGVRRRRSAAPASTDAATTSSAAASR